MLGLVLGLGVRLGGCVGGVVLPSRESGGKGNHQYPCRWWRLCPVYASQTQISNPNFQLSERQNHMNTVTHPRILGNRGGSHSPCRLHYVQGVHIVNNNFRTNWVAYNSTVGMETL